MEAPNEILARSRRRVVTDMLGIALSGIAFGIVYGVAARAIGYTVLDVGVTSALVFAGGAQFAAVAALSTGASWLAVITLVALINARHLLYGAVMAPYFADKPPSVRAALAFLLDDETFALSLAHFRRIGRGDIVGYLIAAIGGTYISWVAGSILGGVVGAAIPDPATLGLNVVFPAAMAGLTVALVGSRREVLAAVFGAVGAVAVALVTNPSVGVIAGGVGGSLMAFLLRRDAGDGEAR